MSFISRMNKMLILAMNPGFFVSKTKYLFVISHMRSRSTLLAHILGSNPGIVGYTELHRQYKSSLDLLKFRSRIFIENRETINNKYILDKVLHNSKGFSNQMLKHKNAKFLFLIREPKGTIKSLIKIGNTENMEFYKDPENDLKYYQDRLSAISQLASKPGIDSYFIESEDFVSSPNYALNKLSDWLELKEDLKANYSMFEKTGQPGYGDISGNIKYGEIVKTNNNSEIIVPSEILASAKTTYEQCKEILLKNCRI